MPKLYILSGPDLGRTIEIASGAVMGRSPECAVHLRHTSVSREHARIERVGDRWTIVDLGSRNGITRRGERLAEGAALEDGDEFQVGEILLRFRTATAESLSAPLTIDEFAPPRHEDASARGEIVLEGAWDADTVNAPRPAVSPVTRTPPPSMSRPPANAPSVASAPRPLARGPRASGAPSLTVVDDRRVLQYARVADRKGLFGSDLAQQPLWVRAALALVAFAVFAGMFWAAYRATVFLKGRAAGQSYEVGR